MTELTFRILCNQLQPYIQRKSTALRGPFSVGRRVVITVRKLATDVEYRALLNLFRTGTCISTVAVIVVETCQAISANLLTRYVYIPEDELL